MDVLTTDDYSKNREALIPTDEHVENYACAAADDHCSEQWQPALKQQAANVLIAAGDYRPADRAHSEKDDDDER